MIRSARRRELGLDGGMGWFRWGAGECRAVGDGRSAFEECHRRGWRIDVGSAGEKPHPPNTRRVRHPALLVVSVVVSSGTGANGCFESRKMGFMLLESFLGNF